MIIDELGRRLNEISNVEFVEYGWRTRPAGDFGVYQGEFDAGEENGDDSKLDRAIAGSVDLYTHGNKWLLAAAVESVLETVCESCWRLNSIQYERETGMVHREWVFEVHAEPEAGD